MEASASRQLNPTKHIVYSESEKEVGNMQRFRKLATMFLVALFLTLTGSWQSSAQDTKSGVVNSRDQILGVTNQNQKQKSNDSHDDRGNPGPLPCKSKNNPKCKPASKSRPEDDDHGHGGDDDHGRDH